MSSYPPYSLGILTRQLLTHVFFNLYSKMACVFRPKINIHWTYPPFIPIIYIRTYYKRFLPGLSTKNEIAHSSQWKLGF